MEQIPFGTNDFAVNPEPRLPCVLLLDVSASMSGKPIGELNEGLQTYRNELLADPLAAKRVEAAVVTFGGAVRTLCDFTTAEAFTAPHLSADGDTPLGAAVLHGLAMIQQRKQAYRSNGIPYFRPWVFLITDGAPTDDWHPAAKAVKDGEAVDLRGDQQRRVSGANQIVEGCGFFGGTRNYHVTGIARSLDAMSQPRIDGR